MEYRGFTLEKFQEQAINSINQNHDVIVSTHTGNGKTLVADYIIDKCISENKTVIYTAPIKALSNQKYRELTKLYGENKIGLITGDVVINQEAPVLLVTTEILRNIIHESPKRDLLENLAFIILDEIHYINDRDRGTVWEEILIFRDTKTKILGLSATVPNAKDLSNWIESISGQPCDLILYEERIVKQTHSYFDKKKGSINYEDMLTELYNAYRKGYTPKKTTHIDFIKYAKKHSLLPVLFFSFSRNGCENNAEDAATVFSLLNEYEVEKVKTIISTFEYEYPDLITSPSWQKVTLSALNGICCHHAGLLPLAKRFVETLFENKLCKVLYATETFAVGINFPVRTVCFLSLRKFDGKGFRNLLGSEYLQMSGRAGRRGYDEFGYVFTLANYEDLERERIPNIALMKSEPVQSQFSLSYNTVINLLCNYGTEETKVFFERGLSGFQHNKHLQELNPNCNICGTNKCPAFVNLDKQLRKEINKKDLIHCSKTKKKSCEKYLKELKKDKKNAPSKKLEIDFNKKIKLLKSLGYINEDNELEARGKLCKNFHIQEIFLTELLVEKNILNLPIERFVGIIGGLCYDGRDEYRPVSEEIEVYETMRFVVQKEYEHNILPKVSFNSRGYQIVKSWMEDNSYDTISSLFECEEGDFVSIVRRTIDVLRQIKIAFGEDVEVVKYINACIRQADRGIVEYFM